MVVEKAAVRFGATEIRPETANALAAGAEITATAAQEQSVLQNGRFRLEPRTNRCLCCCNRKQVVMLIVLAVFIEGILRAYE